MWFQLKRFLIIYDGFWIVFSLFFDEPQSLPVQAGVRIEFGGFPEVILGRDPIMIF